MLKALAILVLSFTGSMALANGDMNPGTQACVEQFQARVQKKIELGVPSKHLPRLYLPSSNPKNTVVIFTHGIFESPYFFKGINNIFAEQGFITLSVLLPGHWEGNWGSMRNVSYRDWISELNENVRIAQCFGNKIIFAGHSLGGLLSMNAALQHPDLTAGVMLWTPALAMRMLPAIGGVLGGLLHIDGNIVYKSPDLDEQALYAPNAAKQVGKMISHVRDTYGGGAMSKVYPRLDTPTFLAYAARDPAVDVDELTRAAHQIRGLKPLDVMFFPTKTGVWHGNIVKSKVDSYKRKKLDYNPRWNSMKEHIELFLRENF